MLVSVESAASNKQIHEVLMDVCRKLFSKSSKLPKSKQLSEEIDSPK